MKVLPKSLKNIKMPSGQTMITIALVVVIVVLLVVVVRGGGQGEEGYVNHNGAPADAGGWKFKDPVSCNKTADGKPPTSARWNENARKCTTVVDGRPECNGAIALFSDGRDQAGKTFNGGKNVLLQYDKSLNGWQKYRKCTANNNAGVAPFRLSTSYGNIPAAPATPESQSVLEKIFVAPIRGLIELLGFGTGASATTGVKIPSDLLNTPVYLNFEGCPGLALSTFGKEKCTDFSTVDAVKNTGVNQTWQIIPVEIDGIADNIPRYCIRSSARKNICDRSYLSVKMNCTDHRVDLWMSRLDKKENSESNIPVVWRAFGGQDNIFTFDNEWRIQAKCNFKVLSLQQCGLSNNSPPKVSLVEPNSTSNKKIKITAAAAGPPAAAAAAPGVKGAELSGITGFKRVVDYNDLVAKHGTAHTFIFKIPDKNQFLNNGEDTSVSGGRVRVLLHDLVGDSNNKWRIDGNGNGTFLMRPTNNLNVSKNYMGAIRYNHNDEPAIGEGAKKGTKCADAKRVAGPPSHGSGSTPTYTYTCPTNCKRFDSNSSECWTEIAGTTPNRACLSVQVVNRWDVTGENHKYKWDLNDRFVWKFEFTTDGFVKLINVGAEKGTFGCNFDKKYLQALGWGGDPTDKSSKLVGATEGATLFEMYRNG